MQTPWSIRAQHQKSVWSFQTGTLVKRVECAVKDSSFSLSKCYLCQCRCHKADVFPVHSSVWFPVVFVYDRNWPLKQFKRKFFDPFWSIKLFLAAKWPFDKGSSFWIGVTAEYPAWILNNLQHVVVFVRELIVTRGLACLHVSFILHHSFWLGNEMVPTKVTKVGGVQNS